LRGTGVLARWADGYDTDQISNDIGMSRQMVDRYMRFKDQMDIAADGRKTPQASHARGIDGTRRRPYIERRERADL
jgi:hypothetical protein